MKNAGIALLSAIGLIVGIAAYGVLKPDPPRPPTPAEVEAETAQLRADAAKAHPEMAQSDAMKKVALDRAREAMNTGDARRRAQTAASIFFGAYFMNTRAKPEYCRKRGTDIAPFVAAYEESHRREFERARAILLEAGLDPERLAPSLQEQFVAMVDQDMKDFATGAQVPLDSVCTLYNENARAIAQAIELPMEVRQALFVEQ
jgi:hypothetical protein